MAGITIEMDNMLPWIGGIGGIVGYPVFLSIIYIIQDIYVLEEVDKDPIASDINVIDSWYELVNIGAKVYNVLIHNKVQRIVYDRYESGSQEFNVIKNTNTQRFIVATEDVVEM